MSVLSVVQDAALKCGFQRPTQLIADTGATSLDIQGTLAEVAAQIRDRYDWQAYKAIGTLTGDGAALSFGFPANYARMTKKARLWLSATPYSPLTHVEDSDEWLGTTIQNFTAVVGMWTIYGGQIQIRLGGVTAPLGLAATAQFFYITNLQFASSGGTAKTAISADDDTFRLTPEPSVGERLLKLGFIAKWKSDHNRPFAQDQSDFEDAMATLVGADKGGKSPMVVGRTRSPYGADIALPWPVV